MNVQEEKLTKIWSQDYIGTLPPLVKDRGFCSFTNEEAKDILITGFNPSFREGENTENLSCTFRCIMSNDKHDNYWSPLKKMIFDKVGNIDLRPQAAYLDLFYFREMNQSVWDKSILKSPNGVQFAVDQLRLTQHIIENVVKPKLIVVKNKESWAYWGKLEAEGFIWMGYQFEFIQNLNCGELYRISGLLNSPKRIAPEFTKTNLENSFILFTQHINQYTAAEKRPTSTILKSILELYNAEMNVRAMSV